MLATGGDIDEAIIALRLVLQLGPVPAEVNFAMATKMDWFGPVVFEAGIAALTILLLFGLWRLLK